jgi:hypothetical protein
MRNLRSVLFFHPALWGLVALQCLIIAFWIAIDPRVSFSPQNGLEILLPIAVCLLVAAAIAYRFPAAGRPTFIERTRVIALGLTFLVITFTGIRFLNYLTMSLAYPLADDRLDSWDKALGIDWYAYASGLSRHPAMLPYIEIPYSATIAAVAVIFVALTILGRFERAKEFVTLLFLGAAVTVSVSGFFPAEAAMAHYKDDHLFAVFGVTAGVYHMQVLHYLRESKDIVLSFADSPGLATFPSFHTIVGLLIVYACRDNIVTLLLAALWTGAMLLATPVYGGHYFIDIIAGSAVTIVLATAYTTVKIKNLGLLPPFAATDARL